MRNEIISVCMCVCVMKKTYKKEGRGDEEGKKQNNNKNVS